MVSLRDKIEDCILSRRLLAARQRVLVAVSGGVDSMALLHLLKELSAKHQWKLIVAHLNHQLRGSCSLADEQLVRRTAHQLKVPIVVKRADVRGFARMHKLSLEMAARELRHDFLARTSVQKGISRVALAHHLGDQVELFFLRLLRGSGSQGLGGMKWISSSPSNSAITLIRPFLDSSKDELREYALRRGIAFREDATNASVDIQRNRIRHELLPLLERKYQPGLRTTILRVMDLLSSESEFVDAAARAWLVAHPGNHYKDDAADEDCHQTSNQGTRTDVTLQGIIGCRFNALPLAVQRRCIQIQLIKKAVSPDFELVERLRLQPGTPIEVSQSGLKRAAARDSASRMLKPLRLARDLSGTVSVVPVKSWPFRSGSLDVDLGSGATTLEWRGLRLEWQIVKFKGESRLDQKLDSEFFDADAVGPLVRLRHWQPGDRFQPIGINKPIKLQDLFVNQKVPQGRRRRLIVATTMGGELFWVEGLRIAERFKLTKQTIRRLLWGWQRL